MALRNDGSGRAFDDLDCPVTGLGRRLRGFRSLIAAITVDALNEWEQTTRAAAEHQRHSVAILNIGGMDRYAQQQAERIDEDMALAPRDLLARIEAVRVEQGPLWPGACHWQRVRSTRKFRSKSRARQSCACAAVLGR